MPFYSRITQKKPTQSEDVASVSGLNLSQAGFAKVTIAMESLMVDWQTHSNVKPQHVDFTLEFCTD